MKSINWIVASVGALVGFLFGKVDTVFYILVAMTVLDYITGVLKAIYKKELSSYIGAKGIVKKAMVYVIVAVAHLVDKAMGMDVVMSMAMFFYIANEGLSILENIAECGVPFPQRLLEILEQLKKEEEK
jgi:toxin secretion/phage lysis holin